MSAVSRMETVPRAIPARPPRVRIGEVAIDAVTFEGAIERIADLVAAGDGGSVFTPNVDHIVLNSHDAAFRDAYRRASLVLADGVPVLWAARLLGTPLPEKVSGSDLILPLLRHAARSGWRVYLLGGGPGVAEDASAMLRSRHGVHVVGHAAPFVDAEGVATNDAAVLAAIRAACPDLVIVALGAPKQERWIDRNGAALGGAVLVAVGGSLDFIIGRVRRAPAWVSRVGLEWVYRLAQEPRRLWRRYLVRDPEFALLVARDMLRRGRRPRA